METHQEKTKKQELEFWQFRLEKLESSSGVTINIGTHGGQVHDSDISINEINTAKAQIARLKSELHGDVPTHADHDHTGIFNMILFIANRQDRVEQGVMSNVEAIQILRNELLLTMRERAAIYIANGLRLIAISLVFIKETIDYGLSNQEHAFTILVLLFMAGILR